MSQMSSKFQVKRVLVLSFTLCVCYLLWLTTFRARKETVKVNNYFRSRSRTNLDVRKVNVETINTGIEAEIPCARAQIRNHTFPICTYETVMDDWISNHFLTGRYYESRHVTYVLELMEADPRLVFIDIGANIGTYTLAVAHMNRRVIAVEPNLETVRLLARSIARGNVSDYVTLLNNAVSDEHVAVRMGQDLRNRGNTFLLKDGNCSQVNTSSCVPNSVNTITLNDDLLPLMETSQSRHAILKIDTQGYEIRGTNRKSARKFFEKINVPVIFMEFEVFKAQYADEAKRKVIEDWIGFMRSLKYTFHEPEKRDLLGSDWLKWTYNIVLMRKNDEHLKL